MKFIENTLFVTLKQTHLILNQIFSWWKMLFSSTTHTEIPFSITLSYHSINCIRSRLFVFIVVL